MFPSFFCGRQHRLCLQKFGKLADLVLSPERLGLQYQPEERWLNRAESF